MAPLFYILLHLNFPCARISIKAFLQYFDFYNFRRYYHFMLFTEVIHVQVILSRSTPAAITAEP